MRTIIHPKYEHLREWVEQLPFSFYQQGTIIYNARNQIRVIIGPDGKAYNVKRYCCPKWYNQLVYSTLRTPKAIRAYNNASRLEQLHIPTPAVIGYILCGNHLLQESYLITEQAPHKHLFYEMGDGITAGREDMLIAFGRFAGEIHEKGVFHLDFSPGNILFDHINNQWAFTLVDINRMHFGAVSLHKGCKNFARLWGGRAMYQLIAKGYAMARNADAKLCAQLMFDAHRCFWHHRPLPKSDFPIVNE